MEISGKGLLYFYQQTSSLIGNQTNHRTNCVCLINPTLAISHSDYDCICIVINGKFRCSFKYFEQCISVSTHDKMSRDT